MGPLTKSDIKRFEAKYVKKDKKECWEWTVNNGRGGQGNFCLSGSRRRISAHRIAYCIRYGKFDETLFVLHKCDNFKCINPSHLYLGTAKDSARDILKRGKSANIKLTKAEVDSIRERSSQGEKGRNLATQFNVTPAAISKIINYLQRNGDY